MTVQSLYCVTNHSVLSERQSQSESIHINDKNAGRGQT